MSTIRWGIESVRQIHREKSFISTMRKTRCSRKSRRIWVSMFQIAAMINFTEISSQGIYIICHVYKNINIGDLLIQVYQNRLYYYTVRRIYGFKDKFCTCAEEGYNYKIEIELPLQFDFEVLENLKYGTYFFGKYNKTFPICGTIEIAF